MRFWYFIHRANFPLLPILSSKCGFFVCIFGAFFERVFRERKICALYFKICPTYFKICRTYFFFAPMWVKNAENQFSLFGTKNACIETFDCYGPFHRLCMVRLFHFKNNIFKTCRDITFFISLLQLNCASVHKITVLITESV